GGTVNVNLRPDAYADLTPVTFTYTNAPDASILVKHSPILTNGNLGPYSATAVGGVTPQQVTIQEATVPATTAIVDSSLTLIDQPEVVSWGAFIPNYMLDMTNLLLREVTDGPTFDIPTGKLSWTEATGGATPDLTIAAIDVTRAGAAWHWEIAAPYASS